MMSAAKQRLSAQIRFAWRVFWLEPRRDGVANEELVVAAAIVVMVIAMLVPRSACASEPQCADGNEAACAVPLMRGQVAPYDGQLLTPTLAIELGIKANNADRWLELELSRTTSLADSRLQHEKELRQIDVAQLTRERDAHERDAARWRADSARKVEPPHWTSHPAFVSSVSVLLTLGLVWTAIQIVHAGAP